MTRFAWLLTVFVAACGDDAAPRIDAPPIPPIDAPGPTIDGGGGGADATPGTPDATPGTPDAAGGGVAPTIEMISWTTTTPCGPGMPTVYTVTMNVTDPDTAADNLTYGGMILGCTGTFDVNPDTFNCPNAAPYSGTLSVTDDTGLSDSLMITINPCANGSAP